MRHKKTPEQQDVEARIIGHMLAAFTEATDYEPDTQSLVMRIDYDQDEKYFKTCVYNDAFKDEKELKPIEARGHFNEVQDVKEYRDTLKDDISITRQPQAREVNVPGIPQLYDPQELLDIFDDVTETMAQRIARGNPENKSRAAVFRLHAGEIKFELRRAFMRGPNL